MYATVSCFKIGKNVIMFVSNNLLRMQLFVTSTSILPSSSCMSFVYDLMNKIEPSYCIFQREILRDIFHYRLKNFQSYNHLN